MELSILIGAVSTTEYNLISKAIKSYSIKVSYNIVDFLKIALNEKISLIILDMNFKAKDNSFEIMSFLSEINKTKNIPVVFMRQTNEGLFFNDFSFFTNKNYTLDDLQNHIQQLIEQSSETFSDIEDVQNFINSLILALESRDSYSKNHSARVSKMSAFIAQCLNLDKKQEEKIKNAGLFHDIGKIGIPDSVLLKAGRLDDREFSVIKNHPVISEQICKPIHFFKPLLPIIRGHHERFDGCGYPDHKYKEEIPLGARIVAVADAFDALTSTRSYRNAFPLDKALSIMKDGAGTQWDKEIVDCFLNSFSEDKIIDIYSQSSVSNFVNKENLLNGTIFKNGKKK